MYNNMLQKLITSKAGVRFNRNRYISYRFLKRLCCNWNEVCIKNALVLRCAVYIQRKFY